MKIMTKNQLKEYIKQNIKEILSEGPQEDTKVKQKKIDYLNAVTAAANSEKTALNKPNTKPTLEENSISKEAIQKKYNEMFGKDPNTTFAKVAKALGITEPEIAQALFMPQFKLEENALNEMAGFYKVKDKAGFKKALKTYKELKGDKFNKNALDRLLVALDKEGEVEITPFSKALKKDPATFNNSNTRAALEKKGGEFTDYIDAYKSKPKDKEEPKKEIPKKEEPKVKKEAPKKEAPKKEAPKKETPKKEVPKKEVPKKKTKDEDNEEVEDEDAMDKKAQAAAKNLDLDFFDFDDEDDF
jgi:hypothetical protein